MKRVIAFLLAVVMTLSMMPVAALNILAAEDPNNDRALLGYAAKAIAGQPVVEDLNNNSFYPGQYGRRILFRGNHQNRLGSRGFCQIERYRRGYG